MRAEDLFQHLVKRKVSRRQIGNAPILPWNTAPRSCLISEGAAGGVMKYILLYVQEVVTIFSSKLPFQIGNILPEQTIDGKS